MKWCALVVAVLALAGCGGKQATSPPCSDAGFRDQDEELYVAQSTAQNAASTAVDPEVLRSQLRQGINALRSYVEAHPPCSDDLKEIADLESTALDGLETAAGRIETSPVPEAVRSDLVRAIAQLRRAGRELAG